MYKSSWLNVRPSRVRPWLHENNHTVSTECCCKHSGHWPCNRGIQGNSKSAKPRQDLHRAISIPSHQRNLRSCQEWSMRHLGIGPGASDSCWGSDARSMRFPHPSRWCHSPRWCRWVWGLCLGYSFPLVLTLLHAVVEVTQQIPPIF
jgi:hypothetical protein